MKSALFFGCVGILFSATIAGASGLPPCSIAEVEQARIDLERSPGALPFRGPGITCEPGVPDTVPDRPAGKRGDGRGSRPNTGIDRSKEPCWIEFPSGRSGYCNDQIPPTIVFPRPTRRPTVPVGRPPQPSPSKSPNGDEAAEWRRLLLNSLPESTDILGNPAARRTPAPSPLPTWQPRQPPVNLLAPPPPTGQPRQPPATPLAGSPKRDTGCGRGPSAAC
jgi:hypothetical protein